MSLDVKAKETSHNIKEIPSRRIFHENEISISGQDFTQIIDIDLTLKGNVTKDLPNMPDYPVRSLENAINYIHWLQTKDIFSVVIRMGGSVKNEESSVYSFDPLFIGTEQKYNELYENEIPVYQFLKAQKAAYKLIRTTFSPKQLQIIGDPFGIAPNKNGGWGIQHEGGSLNYEKTEQLIKEIAKAYSEVELDGILTLGRIYKEVQITRKALDKINSNTKIYSFSQNIESKTAYIYLDEINNRRDTGQKIIPGNITEMALHTLLDIYEGTDVIVVKPTENYHAIYMTNNFLTNKQSILSFLQSNKIKDICQTNIELNHVVEDIVNDIDNFYEEKCKKVRLSTYTVSGSYYLQKLLGQEKGENFTYNVLDETFKNAKSAAGECFITIMDRNANWYLSKKN
ncbi:delta-aminolevulinic acid dehydratase [Priestia megaterium]|uniref:delta-aminolevulinic acid dehydratase n=1 Tax=Priestia megaterium TaxID=1404 RepID=UPI002452B514|nr:delta-aminolevulinic acid dehydratase [Priestia megaterium]MDH3161301.1 delta-aminolevulinic acid dehydratase [Priestia megaterium]MED4116887.1 delta-aminolevulinic acid dehydratase [Priestia megaterium]